MHVAGIDVGYKSLFVVVAKSTTVGKAREFDNQASGHQAVIKALRKARVDRICLEATGLYHLDLAVALVEAGFELMVVNPKAAKRFAEAMLERHKSDPIDATLLSEFAQRMPFKPWQRPSDQSLMIRACARRLAALNKGRTEAKNQRHAAVQTQRTPDFVLEDIDQSIGQFDEQIHRLRARTLVLIENDEPLSDVLRLLVSVKGIAQNSAIQLMGELLVLPEDMNAKQWVAMAGLDPRHHTSGSSVHKKPRLSKAGNRYLRMALYMPALSASRNDRHVRAYYHHLIEDRGLKKIQAVCAVMRKLLHAIHGMLRTHQVFDNRRFYEIPEQA